MAGNTHNVTVKFSRVIKRYTHTDVPKLKKIFAVTSTIPPQLHSVVEGSLKTIQHCLTVIVYLFVAVLERTIRMRQHCEVMLVVRSLFHPQSHAQTPNAYGQSDDEACES